MPRFKFQGFQTGTQVTLAADQGADSVNASVATWGQADTSSLTLSLSASRNTGLAPFGALYTATAASSAARVAIPFHDIEGVWNYGDPGNFTALDNNPIWGTDADTGYGPRGVHVHEAPGSYTIAHTAYDGDGSRTETLTVTVEDPDTVFAGADTAVVSAAGSFSGAPSAASQFTTVTAALAHLSGRQNQRLLLRFDETFTDTIDITETSGSGRRLYIGRFGGTSQKPLIDKSGTDDTGITVDGDSFDEVVICNLRIQGGYDPTNPPSGGEPGGNGPRFAHKTLWGLELSNLGGVGVELGGTGGDIRGNLYMANCRILGWRGYGVHGGDVQDVGFAGNVVRQPTGTINGSQNTTPPWWARVAPFRLSRPRGVTVFSNNDTTCFNDWSASSSARGFQAHIRWNSGGDATNSGEILSDKELVIDRHRAEGGEFQIYNATGGGYGITDNFVLIDRLHHINTAHHVASAVIPMGGTTLRNAVLVAPNTPAGTSTGMRRFVTGSASEAGGSVLSGAQTRRSEVYSCAFVDLRTDANTAGRSGSQDRDFNPGDLDDIAARYFANNLHFAPNMVTGGTTEHAPHDLVTRWSVVYDGERWEGGPVDTARAYTDEVTAEFSPQPGSVAIGAGSGKTSLLDFHGNLRDDVLAGLSRSAASVGPFEPDLES